MAEEFVEGDVVLLNSDNKYRMTISEISANSCRCVWFDPQGALKAEEFRPASLRLAPKRGAVRTSIVS